MIEQLKEKKEKNPKKPEQTKKNPNYILCYKNGHYLNAWY